MFVQVFDPAAFGGADAFTRRDGLDRRRLPQQPAGAGRVDAVRLPGQQALANKRAALQDGVTLYAGIMDALKPWAEKWKIAAPLPIGA